MTPPLVPDELSPERVLILAATGADNRVLSRSLSEAGAETLVCKDVGELCAELLQGAGAALVAAESLGAGPLRRLSETLRGAPAWSDIPVIVMARRGESAERSAAILRRLENDARVTFLERPVARVTLASAVHAALAARRHQYRIRDTLDRMTRAERALKESEARFRLAVQNGPVLVFGADAKLRYTWVAHPTKDLEGRAIVGHTDEELFGRDRGRPLMEIKRRVLESGVGERIEHWIQLDRGWTAWDLSLEPIRDEDDAVVGLTGVAMDVTERKGAERRLARAEARLRAAVEGSGIGVFEYDGRTNRLDASEQSRRIVLGDEGTASTDLLRWRTAIHPEDRECADRAWARALDPEGDGHYEVDYRVIRLDGSARWVSARGKTRFDEDGSPSLVGTVQDVTEDRATEERLRVLTNELEKLVAARTEKLEERTHQLRRLANQLVFAEQRERTRLAQLLHDHLQQILAAAKIQIDLFEDKQGGEDLAEELEMVRDLLEEAVNASRSLSMELSPPALQNGPLPGALQWQAQWMESHHRLHTDLVIENEPPEIDPEVKIFLFEAVRELLFNAVKHADVERCTLRLRADDSRLEVAVEDEGKGFDPERLQQTQAEGFGLFSIQERLEAMGGKMQIESAPGKGSKFRLYIPRSERPEAVAPPPWEAAPAERAPREKKKIRLLIVDDHPIVRDGLVSMLRRSEDMEVVGEASDGEEAIELAGALKPDVIVMDLNMPRVDGLTATREIKRDQPAIQIVGLSIQGEEAAAEEMVRAGASAFLPKGGRSERLFETLRRVVARG